MKTIKYLVGLLAIAMYSCSSLSTSTAYGDDVYYNPKKAKAETSQVEKYSSSPAYQPAPENNQAPLKSAYNQPETQDNRDFSKAQKFYSEEMNDSLAMADSINYEQIETDQSYADRIARFNGSDPSRPYYSDNEGEYNDNVTVYVDGGYYNPWYDNFYFGAPYMSAYWGSGNNWGFGLGYGFGYGFGYGYPYYGYGYPYYGYGYPYYNYGHPYYNHGCGYYSPHYGGDRDYYSSHSNSNVHYGPRSNGGSRYSNNTTNNPANNNTVSRAPRDAQSTSTGSSRVSSYSREQYARPSREASYSGYSRSAQTNGATRNAPRVSTETTYRKNYSPNYVQPSNNARSQYNSNGYSRPATSAAPRSSATTTQQQSNSRTVRPVISSGSNEGNTNRSAETTRSAPSYQSAPSYSAPSSGGGGSRSGGGSSSGGGVSRAPRR